MMFEFNAGTKIDTQKWMRVNTKLRSDLLELVDGFVSEEEVLEYLKAMVAALRNVENGKCDDMLFLMFDEPNSMPADARVDFVYTPTYIAATIMMTAVYRYKKIQMDEEINETLKKVLNATTGRKFLGAGYETNGGLMDTLELFALGDTYKFVEKFPELNERFTLHIVEAVTFLETSLCTGKVVEPWSGDSYSERANQILTMIKGKNKLSIL